ncbi:cartilage matrix protein-like [Orbicella faveolata]|uniref:cartilage matrix protein-like n=1 Tax=Orbicella faveolata TaxID=48498 RepID=UPI0009E454E8|nr:cartilage matrix protein-like [Orbicella faveolata]
MTALGFAIFFLGVSLITVGAEISKCKLDLGLLVDTTKSIKYENLPILKDALRYLMNQFDVSPKRTHVSLQTFDRRSTLHNKFNDDNYHSNKAINDLITNSITKLDQPTRLDIALKTAKELMFTEQSGQRPGVRSAMVLYTDGRSHPSTEDFFLEIVSLKTRGVRIIVVGIGPDARKNKYRQVLEYIGGTNLFYVDDYASLDNATQDIKKLICPPDPCENSKGMDVAFIVDKTKSLGVANFLLLKGFLLELVAAMHIGPNATHTAIMTFSRKPKVLSTFAETKFYSNEAVHQFIAEIPVFLGDRTFTDKALMAAANKLFIERAGDRQKYPNVLILLTDGRTNPKSQKFSEITPKLKEKNVRIIAVGIGQYEDFQGQLEEIAGNNVHNASNFDELSNLFNDILAETCSVDGGFSGWSFWSDCSLTCGGGVQTRTRTCTYPPPQGYGEDCDGPLQDDQACNKSPCPGDDEGQIEAFKHP